VLLELSSDSAAAEVKNSCHVIHGSFASGDSRTQLATDVQVTYLRE